LKNFGSNFADRWT